MISRIFLFGVFCLVALGMKAQETMVVGRVFSSVDKMPVSAVNVYFSSTKQGTQTDEDGFFVLKNTGPESKLIFSCIGYKTREIKIEPGKIANVTLHLQEDISLLQDLFVVPGANPAIEILKKVRAARLQNDLISRGAILIHQEDNLALLRKSYSSESASMFFGLFADGLISTQDSSVFLPLYISQDRYRRQGTGPRQFLSKNSKASPENLKQILEKMTGEMGSELNFYNNNVLLLGKNFVSPLSVSGNTFYHYFLIDSVYKSSGKQYYIRYKSKNRRNLAFNGEIWIDSATHALAAINAAIPGGVNLNYVDRLKISKTYKMTENAVWSPEKEELAVRMDYQLRIDSSSVIPGFYLQRSIQTQFNGFDASGNEQFAGTEFSKDDIEMKLAEMNDLPLMKTARWIADVVLTSYMNTGYFDIGRVQNLARISQEEGFRFNLPIRTNETLWENLSVGGYWGYGMRNNRHNYSAETFLRLPFDRKTVLGAGYTDDLRRIDYDYNDFMPKENPLLSGDEDISNTLFAFRSTDKLHQRRELYVSLMHDWNNDVESTLFFRNNSYAPGNQLPFTNSQGNIPSMKHQFLHVSTRFSKDERTYEDHLQRIYIQNFNPVVYLNMEAGKSEFAEKTYLYAKLSLKIRHNVLLGFGQWNYNADAGFTVGSLPYNLLFIPVGSETLLFKRYHYNLMDYMEYAYDKYFAMHHELVLNGIIFNQIPLVNKLNLRELFSFKLLYGSLNSRHATLLDFPESMSPMKVPYIEVGAGITNILRIFSLQAVWRLSDLQKPGVRSWGIMTGIRVSF